jgi:ubiquinone/menaquinone biosynthesis C-methylase UbiE
MEAAMFEPEECVSRFIRTTDEKESFFIYELPEAWWSRHYEYFWASQFVTDTDVVLDAASGICHPFKFYLGIMAQKAYACDADYRIISRTEILADIKTSVGEKAHDEFNHSLFNRVTLRHCDLKDMPFNDNMFNKVFCISVLEHLDEQTQLRTLLEFSRVLKKDGLLVMTVDYPAVNMEQLMKLMDQIGFTFYGDCDFKVPEDALSSTMWGSELKCIRLLLRKV